MVHCSTHSSSLTVSEGRDGRTKRLGAGDGEGARGAAAPAAVAAMLTGMTNRLAASAGRGPTHHQLTS